MQLHMEGGTWDQNQTTKLRSDELGFKSYSLARHGWKQKDNCFGIHCMTLCPAQF